VTNSIFFVVRARAEEEVSKFDKKKPGESSCFFFQRRMATPLAGSAVNLRDVHGRAHGVLRGPSPSPAGRPAGGPPRRSR
jgi:hypothetical protein